MWPEVIDGATLSQHMQMLGKMFTVMPLGEACVRLARGTLPSRAVCLTFDDGYADNEEVAFPILKRLGIPATFFVSTGYIDGGIMFNDGVIETLRRAPGGFYDLSALGLDSYAVDDIGSRRMAANAIIQAVKYRSPTERGLLVQRLAAEMHVTLPSNFMMSAVQIRRLHAAGMEIGAHTVNHPILTSLSDEDAQAEIADSKRMLEDITGARVTLFAYPNGKPGQDYDAQHVRLVKQAGFSAAVCTTRGICTRASDPFQLPRIGSWDSDPRRLAARLLYMCARERGSVSREGGSPSGTRDPVIERERTS
jgi:peptidoglycan/xylan/chitin deacetylase (PgdA/CDA1 family)